MVAEWIVVRAFHWKRFTGCTEVLLSLWTEGVAAVTSYSIRCPGGMANSSVFASRVPLAWLVFTVVTIES
jgi:hypothetical protein